MIQINIQNETAPLEAVVLGTALSFGGTPTLDNTNDPKSIQHILAGTFPAEEALIKEMETFNKVLIKYGVNVYRPNVISNYNQIFSRDIGLVIEDRFVLPLITHNRRDEIKGIQHVVDQIDPDKILRPSEHERMEGGDVIPWNGHLFVGYSEQADFDAYIVARTNRAGVDFLIKNFPQLQVHAFELKKSDTDPRENALHLDCCFQPIGRDQAILYPEGFKNTADVDFLVDFFGKENIIEVTKEEMYDMNCNVFSISEKVIVTEQKFDRLNAELVRRGFIVEPIPYAEVSKMEGLLRCSTLPLRRKHG